MTVNDSNEKKRLQRKQMLDENDKQENRGQLSRLNVLFILLTLKNRSSEKHPLSIAKILEYTKKDFSSAGEPLSLNRSTVERILDTLMENENFGFGLSDLTEQNFDLHNLGFRLFCVVKGEKNRTWIPYTPDMEDMEDEEDKKSKRPVRYFYCKSVFSDAELTTLIDAVEVYNYFSPNDIVSLINKLLHLNPQSILATKKRLPDKSLKVSHSLVMKNIELLNQIIQEQKFARITYYTYSFSPEKRKIILVERAGYPCKIRPLSMMWSNGNYYLVAMLDSQKGPKPTPANLRIDRISNIYPLDPAPGELEKFQPPCEISPSIYRLNHPVMFGGNPEEIAMLCRENPYNGMVNAIMDTFGTQARCRPATSEELEQYLGYGTSYCPEKPEKWIHVRVRTTTGGVELFATQYCRNCRVISPQAVADRVKRNLDYGTLFYSSNDPSQEP